jgi:hypothetical protein
MESTLGLFRRPLAGAIAECTHVFLVISPGIVSGDFVLREIEMAMSRWLLEMLPSIVCVVEPDVAARLLADPAVPLAVRFLLTFCPQMTFAESVEPALVRYVLELTRREGKWHDWLALLSPSTFGWQVFKLAGIVDPLPEN